MRFRLLAEPFNQIDASMTPLTVVAQIGNPPDANRVAENIGTYTFYVLVGIVIIWAVSSLFKKKQNLLWLVVFGIVAYLFAVGAGAVKKKHEWREFSCADGGYTIMFPGVPTKIEYPVSTTMGTLTSHRQQLAMSSRAALVTFSASGEVVFLVCYIEYPLTGPANHERMLEAARDGMVGASKECRVLAERNIDVQGNPGRELDILDSEGGTEDLLSVRMFMVGPRLYQAIFVRDKRSGLPEVKKKFFDSFKLLGTTQSPGANPKKAPIPDTSATQTVSAIPSSPTGGMNTASARAPALFTCSSDIGAFNPSNPAEQIGIFKKDSVLTIGDQDAKSGMFRVTYKESNGNAIRALCRAQDLGR